MCGDNLKIRADNELKFLIEKIGLEEDTKRTEMNGKANEREDEQRVELEKYKVRGVVLERVVGESFQYGNSKEKYLLGGFI